MCVFGPTQIIILLNFNWINNCIKESKIKSSSSSISQWVSKMRNTGSTYKEMAVIAALMALNLIHTVEGKGQRIEGDDIVRLSSDDDFFNDAID